MPRPSPYRLLAGMLICALLAACGGGGTRTRSTPLTAALPVTSVALPAHRTGIDVYRYDQPNELSPAVAGDPPLVYVPNSMGNTVDVIFIPGGRCFARKVPRTPTTSGGPLPACGSR